jgi:hypothetical protein
MKRYIFESSPMSGRSNLSLALRDTCQTASGPLLQVVETRNTVKCRGKPGHYISRHLIKCSTESGGRTFGHISGVEVGAVFKDKWVHRVLSFPQLLTSQYSKTRTTQSGCTCAAPRWNTRGSRAWCFLYMLVQRALQWRRRRQRKHHVSISLSPSAPWIDTYTLFSKFVGSG